MEGRGKGLEQGLSIPIVQTSILNFIYGWSSLQAHLNTAAAGGHCLASFSLASIYGHPDLRPVVTEGDQLQSYGMVCEAEAIL